MVQYPVTFITGQHYKVDKSYIWLGSVLTTIVAAFLVVLYSLDGVIKAYFALRDQLRSFPILLVVVITILVFAVIFGIVVLLYYLSYKNMSFVFDERELSFYSGIVVKKRVHLPYERVQSVNHHASILQRVAGVCTVVIDSAGGATNKGVRIPYVRLQVAERIRSDLFVRKAAANANAATEYVSSEDVNVGINSASQSIPSNALDSTLGVVGDWRGAFGGASYVEEPVTFEYGLSNKQLALASFTHPGPLIGGLITALCILLCLVPLIMLEMTMAAVLVFLLVPLVIGVALVIWVLASIGILLGYGNFKVRRRGTRIEIERGLITPHFSGIDVNRIQSVNIKQSIVRKLMHYCELSLGRIDVQTNDNTNKNSVPQGLIIHPFLQVDQIEMILDGLLPEYSARPRLSDCKPLPSVALRRSVLRRCLWYNWVLWLGLVLALGLGITWAALFSVYGSRLTTVMFGPVLQIGITIIIVCVIVACAIAALGAVLWARNSRYCFKGHYLLLHNDGLYTSTSLIPRQKIQSGNTRSNPFQRRLKLQTIVATTAAGFKKTDIRLLDVPQSDAAAYLEWLQ